VETAYEGAFRPHELLSLTKSMVAFDEYGAKISLQTGKTGPRSVRVVNASPLLAEWISQHPVKSNDAPLWVDMSNDTEYRALRWLGLAKIVKRIAKRAGIEKRVNVYVFRHTRLTNLSKELTEPQLCMIAGWELGSDMPRNYVHLSGRDVDEALLKTYGLVKSKATKEIKIPKKCVRCGTVCSAEAETCSKCGMALTLTAAIQKDEELAELKKIQERQQETLDLILRTPGLADLFRKHTSPR
ncbi:MAG: tyrosine-type recombinase/integrase, partial [Nitrososphaerota archaeon]|nr:tyrosine-type recombinase/integrase [Nitrososphaerota archaeon]